MGLCKCGCGFYTADGNDYIHGHNRRGIPSYTSNGRWAMKYDKCISCGSVEYPHQARGLCTSCYSKKIYACRKHKMFDKWSKKYSKCKECGRIDRPHAAKGLCGACYTNYLNRKKGKPKRNFGAWSWYYDKCQNCGTTERAHAKNGLCVDCYRISKRSQPDLVECPVCGAKVNKLSQHLSMRSRYCKDHDKYQYNRFKAYFDSDLNLSDISDELGMDRHSVTRQFVKYFGEEETKLRNELVRRCNISEKAVINENYRNMYGSVVEYQSPHQGIIRLRSKLEADYARQLDEEGVDWYYEYKSFPYIDLDGKRRNYTPDFYLPRDDIFIEIKNKDLLNDIQIHKINWVNDHSDVNIKIEYRK